jgi:nucleotide-binding universal stress UspA family protein
MGQAALVAPDFGVNMPETGLTERCAMFERILLALDDSPAGELATAFTGALARRAGASVHVLHVNERLVGGNGVTLQTRQEATDLVTAAVHQLAEAGVRAGGSVCMTSYRGVPAQIVRSASERSAGAIVLGSTRRRRLGRLFSAQVRERTTRMTSLPVLVAPAPLTVTSMTGADPWQAGLDQVLDSLPN